MHLLQLAFLFIASTSASIPEKKMEAMNRVKMDPKQVEKVQHLHYGWYMQAVNSVVGSISKQYYMKMKRDDRRAFVACLDSIEKEYDVKAASKCLVHYFDGDIVKKYGSKMSDRKYDFVTDDVPESKIQKKEKSMLNVKKKLLKKRTTLRVQRAFDKVVKKKVTLAKRRKKMRRQLVSKPRKRKTVKFLQPKRGKRNILSLYSNDEKMKEAKRVDSLNTSPYKPKNQEKLTSLLDTKKSPVKKVTQLIRGLVRGNESKVGLKGGFSKLERLQDILANARMKNRFKHRMLDRVLGDGNALRRPKTFTDRVRDMVPDGQVDENVFNLVDTVSKYTNDTNTEFLSPRFLPILPNKYDSKKKVLSPSLFPLYKDDSENSIVSIPDALEKGGLNKGDRDAVLELVMDVSGVNSVVDEATQLVTGLADNGLDGDMFDITKLIGDAFNFIGGDLSKNQRRDFVNKKFSFMTKPQFERLYGETGVYNTSLSEVPFDMNEVEKMSTEHQEESLKLTIRSLASGHGATEPSKLRQKRQTLSFLVDGWYRFVFLSPTLFSPASFSPTFNTLSTLGPLVISPQLFCPSVLSPLLMSPPVISPQVGNPLIFSPYVVGPNVLSAAVFNAYVFSPYVLSPNVINPYVMSPLILSPFVLCPDVVSPTVLSGVVLSPSVLSPSIFTDSALAASVLSPTFLS